MEKHKDYYAFISYKREDERMAKWLQHKLEHYKLPSNLNGRTDLPRSIRPIFRNATELIPGNLPKQIHDALEASQHLIVICSPRSAQSYWVNKEVETFIGMGKQDNIIPYIIDGQPFAEDVDDECFPPAIRNMPKEKEILGANVNEMGQNAAAVKTVAKMLGVRFDNLWKRYEREQKTKRLLMILAVALFVVAVLGVATWIWSQNNNLKETISRAAANKALSLIEEGDSYLARQVATAAFDVFPTIEAEIALRQAWKNNGAILKGHEDKIESAVFSRDGKYVVSASFDKSVRIWDVRTGKCIDTLRGHTDWVHSASFSNDGKYIVSSSSDRTTRIWDMKTRKCIDILEHGLNYGQPAFFDPNDKYIYMSSGTNILIWDVKTREFIDTLRGHTDFVISASISNDGKYIVSASFDGTARIWNVETRKCINILKGHTSPVNSVLFSPDNKYIGSASADSTIRLWDTQTGKCIKVLKEQHQVNTVSFSRDNKYIVSASDGANIIIWDVESGKSIEVLEGHLNSVSSALFDNDGKYIVSASNDETIRIWDMGELGVKKYVYTTRLSNDGEYIVSALSDSTIGLWSTMTRKYIDTLMCEFDFFYDGELNMCDNYIILMNIDYFEIEDSNDHIHFVRGYNSIRVLDQTTGKCIKELNLHSDSITMIDITTDCKYMISVDTKKNIRIWDMIEGKCIDTLGNTNRIFFTALFSPNDKYIISGYGSTIRIWDVETRKCINVLKGHTAEVDGISLSNDGKYIISRSLDRIFCVWDMITGKFINKFEWQGSEVYGYNAEISSDGSYIVLYGNDQIVIYDMETRKNINEINLHGEDAIYKVEFTKDNEYLLSSSSKEIINIWDIKTGKCVDKFETKFALFGADGKSIILVSKGSEIKISEFLPLRELIDKTREQFKDYPLTPEERRKYYLE